MVHGKMNLDELMAENGVKMFPSTPVHSFNGRTEHCRRQFVNGKWDHTVWCPMCLLGEHLWEKAGKLKAEGKIVEAEALKSLARQFKPVDLPDHREKNPDSLQHIAATETTSITKE